MKVLVTGASGFLGSHVVEQLVKAGHDVRALVRRSSNRDFLERLGRVEFVYGGIDDAAALGDAVKGVDAIVHSAGLVKARSPEEFHSTNVKGTELLLEAAKKNAPGLRRFVFVSSLAAVGPSFDGVPIGTDRAASPVTHYGRSKLEAERAVIAAKNDLNVVVLRPAAIYGPRDQEIFAFFQAVDRRVLPTVGKGDSTMSMIFGADCAEACIKAIDADVPSGSVYFVDDGVAHPFRSMLEQVESALGKKALLRVNLPLPILWMAAFSSEVYGKIANKAVMLTRDKVNEIRQPHWVCDSSSTRRELGWEPRMKLAEGLATTAKWYQENGWL
jgi:nucleoside-diphosphate-sugar epimerase